MRSVFTPTLASNIETELLTSIPLRFQNPGKGLRMYIDNERGATVGAQTAGEFISDSSAVGTAGGKSAVCFPNQRSPGASRSVAQRRYLHQQCLQLFQMRWYKNVRQQQTACKVANKNKYIVLQ